MSATSAAAVTVRALAKGDLDAVVAIDATVQGRSRRVYLERRLQAALRAPAQHVQLAAIDGRGLAGHILARVLSGEFGGSEPALRLEMVAVREDARGHGTGRALLAALSAWASRRGIRQVRTQAAWNEHDMLRWLDAMRFTLAQNHVVSCAVGGPRPALAREARLSEPVGDEPGREINYGGPVRDSLERLGRDGVEVRSMAARDLADIAHIDRRITGQAREQYMRERLDEALLDSGIRVSLTARLDGAIAGYLMASADLGDFGRAEPVAVIDTIGVDPDRVHRGVGQALVSQLFTNLGALRIERIETTVAPRDLGLLGFLYAQGFTPAPRLPFELRL